MTAPRKIVLRSDDVGYHLEHQAFQNMRKFESWCFDAPLLKKCGSVVPLRHRRGAPNERTSDRLALNGETAQANASQISVTGKFFNFRARVNSAVYVYGRMTGHRYAVHRWNPERRFPLYARDHDVYDGLMEFTGSELKRKFRMPMVNGYGRPVVTNGNPSQHAYSRAGSRSAGVTGKRYPRICPPLSVNLYQRHIPCTICLTHPGFRENVGFFITHRTYEMCDGRFLMNQMALFMQSDKALALDQDSRWIST
ncbi:unnamed protein product [Caenorhabditis auriculariae]|uniref:Uncharacterized protein n=1 Tax=Caenorhabditis auriculariae TaxID=2777116 RepID=A0A8S1H1H7_9PELO|nr:unnamed protein product [Caenorhabditis auriculariae]